MDPTILEDLGLTGAEIKVYIALLELGSSTAGPVLEQSGLQNSVVHRAFHSLLEKGLVTYIREGKRRLYQATNPENFHDFIAEKKRRFDEILPALKQKQQLAPTNTSGELFKGKRGLRHMYTTILNGEGQEYNTFGGGSEVTYDVMGEEWWKGLHTRRIEKQVPSRQVFDESIHALGNELNKQPLTEIRFLPKEYAQLQETIIFGDYVGIAIFTENPYGMLIKDPVVADGYRKHFELLWKAARR